MSRELMPKSGIMMPHVVVTRDAAVVGVSTVDGQAGTIDLTGKYLQKTDAAAIYQTKTEGASKDYVLDSIQPLMSGALFRADPWVVNDTPFRSTGANGVESVDMMKVTPDNSIKIGSYASSVQGVEIHSAGRLQVVDQNDSGVETKYPVYSKRYRPEIEDLPFAAIGSYVKDSKGRTVGVTRTGINSDIKQLTQKVTFTQPVTVPDAVGDYDAVTLRQLRNSGGGSGGPTMSGISNFGIGDFHLRDSRAFIPAFEVPSDGQLLSRTDYPDLWAYAQLLSPIEDSLWLGSNAQRGKYSNGDGSTTFRVPDRNGVQSGSVPGLFGRGDGGDSAINGIVRSNAAPNITGALGASMTTLYDAPDTTGTGAIVPAPIVITGFKMGVSSGTAPSLNYRNGLDIDASLSNPAYGRDGTAEVRPNAFTGVWTIRAHGGFTAANTSWSVINSDTTTPSTGVTVNGGSIKSEYKIGTNVECDTTIYSGKSIGQNKSYTTFVTSDKSGASSNITFDTDGRIVAKILDATYSVIRGDSRLYSRAVTSGTDFGPAFSAIMSKSNDNTLMDVNFGIRPEWNKTEGVRGIIELIKYNADGTTPNTSKYWKFQDDGNAVSSANWINSASDERVKKDFKPIENPFDSLRKIRSGTWRMNLEEGDNRFGIGVLANGLYDDYPEAAIFVGDKVTADGKLVKDVMSVQAGDSGVCTALFHAAILQLKEENEQLKSELAEIKQLLAGNLQSGK